MKHIKPVAKFALATQILFPLLFSATSVASAVNTKQEKINHREVLAKIQSNLPELASKQTESETHSMTGDELLAQGLNKSAQIISADNRLDAVENLAQSTAYGFASTQMTNWLNQYGNANIQISSDKSFSGEYFLPFYETEDNLFFSQSRIQRQDEDRTTLNLGLGYRYFMTNKMWGVNSFYDHDLKNHNARWGLGAEFGADYIKLAANGYFRLTDWRESRLSAFHDYDERPANGFDIKAEGFLPSYPQLGANIKYEKYFGDKVNLKGSNSISDLKKDPQAYTVGISYTPVPLLSFSLNQSMGDVNQTKGELAVNYRIGVPLSQQLDTDLVPQMRTLIGARYNPVDRNNTIVMQYKKHEESATFDVNNINQANIEAKNESNKVTLTVTLKDSKGKPVTDKTVNIVQIDDNGKSSIVGTADKSKDGTYIFTPTLDKDGTYKFGFTVNGEQATSTVEVDYKAESNGNDVNINNKDQANIEAKNESNKVTLTVTLKDSKGNPVTDKTVNIIQIIDDKDNSSPVNTEYEIKDGKYIFTTELSESGKYKFGFTVNGEQATSTAVVEYKAESNGGENDDAIIGTIADTNTTYSKIVVNKNEVDLYAGDELTMIVQLRDNKEKPIKVDDEIKVTRIGGKDDITCKYVLHGNYECTPVKERWGKTQFQVMDYNEVISAEVNFYKDVITWNLNDLFNCASVRNGCIKVKLTGSYGSVGWKRDVNHQGTYEGEDEFGVKFVMVGKNGYSLWTKGDGFVHVGDYAGFDYVYGGYGGNLDERYYVNVYYDGPIRAGSNFGGYKCLIPSKQCKLH